MARAKRMKQMDLYPAVVKQPVWTPQQEAVFEAVVYGKGNLGVVARAGSGKSTTILEAARRLPRGVHAGLTAFGRDIAAELQRKAPKHLRVKTFNAAGYWLLRSHGHVCEFDSDKGMYLARRVAGHGAPQQFVTTIKRAASKFKAHLVDDVPAGMDVLEQFDEFGGKFEPEKVATMALQAMELALTERSTIDYDDQIWLPLILNLEPDYPHDLVFVDEAQDMSPNQLKLSFALAGGVGRIVVVFDPFQGIYEWRGAGAAAFQRTYASLNAKELSLSVTFRCAKAIVDLAQTFVPDIEAREGAEEGKVEHIKSTKLLTLVRPGDAVLSRNNATLIVQCTAAMRAGIKSNIMGRELGQALSNMVNASGAYTVDELRDWAQGWVSRELKKRVEKDQDTQPVLDKAACLEALADGARSVEEIQSNISKMYDDADDTNRVTFSSTHRFKGMERERVFLLWDTYGKPRPSVDRSTGEKTWDVTQEERNLQYVAITRAKRELYLVEK
jgi:DNA helicase II / ATP-dependent DNA helicase PcrA